MPDLPLNEKSKAAFHAARKILEEHRTINAQVSGSLTAARIQKLSEAGNLFRSAREYKLAALPHSSTGGRVERHDAAAALVEEGQTHYEVGDMNAARTRFTTARTELQELLRSNPNDKKIMESFANTTLVLGQTEYYLGNIGDAEALFGEADAIYTQLGKPDMVDHVKKNLTVTAKKAAEIEPVKSPQFWFATAFLILCMVGVGIFGGFRATPHALLSSDTHAFGRASRSVLPHSLIGSSVAVLVFGVVWFVWQRKIWRSKLGLERHEGPQQIIGLSMVMFASMGFVAFYLGDVLYHMLHGG